MTFEITVPFADTGITRTWQRPTETQMSKIEKLRGRLVVRSRTFKEVDLDGAEAYRERRIYARNSFGSFAPFRPSTRFRRVDSIRAQRWVLIWKSMFRSYDTTNRAFTDFLDERCSWFRRDVPPGLTNGTFTFEAVYHIKADGSSVGLGIIHWATSISGEDIKNIAKNNLVADVGKIAAKTKNEYLEWDLVHVSQACEWSGEFYDPMFTKMFIGRESDELDAPFFDGEISLRDGSQNQPSDYREQAHTTR
jgi:hypothetical protein